MKTAVQTSVVSILRKQEKERQIKFWEMLLKEGANTEAECPTRAEPPRDSIYFGLMPRHLRGAFVRTVQLHSEGHAAEARVLDAAVSDLLQEHFREQLARKEKHGDPPIAEFRVTKDWHIYAIPFKH
jgi:hypothetical protein